MEGDVAMFHVKRLLSSLAFDSLRQLGLSSRFESADEKGNRFHRLDGNGQEGRRPSPEPASTRSSERTSKERTRRNSFRRAGSADAIAGSRRGRIISVC